MSETKLIDLPQVAKLRSSIPTPLDFGRYSNLFEVIENVSVMELMNTVRLPYQRQIEPTRVMKLLKKMQKYGVMPGRSFIIVDEENQIIDGQQRLVALYLLGWETVTVIKYNFEEIPHAKAALFGDINTREGGDLSAAKRVQTDRLAQEQYAIWLYQLGYFDDTSKWQNQVGFCDVPNPKRKISVTNFLKIFNWIGLRIRRKMEGGSKERINRKIEQTTFSDVRERMNDFYDWLFTWASKTVTGNMLYKDNILIGVMEFYLTILEQPEAAKIKQLSARKLKGYDLGELSNLTYAVVPGALITLFNGYRKTYRINV